MEAKYQLDGSLWEQYLAYLGRLAHLDLGPWAKYRDWQVSEILAQKLPNSISIGSIAFVLASTIGVLLGSIAAMNKDSAADRVAMFGSVDGHLAAEFHHRTGFDRDFRALTRLVARGRWGTAQQMILPAICLSAPSIAYIARLMRNSLLDVLKSDFLRTARAKGLSETAAVARHAAKIALWPIWRAQGV